MRQIEIDHPYQPRKAFVPYHRRKERFSCIVAHRRAGKTVAAINGLIKSAMTCPHANPRVAYIAPYYAQAKTVAWDYAKEYSAPIPGIKINESELRIDYPNGGRLRLAGADNFDALRGIYLDDLVLDEAADHPPDAWNKVFRPALSDRKGRATFIGSVKGRNEFYNIYQRARKSDEWFDTLLKASETGILDEEELASAATDMSDSAYAQEYECDFDAAVEGAYFGKDLAAAQAEGRVSKVAFDPNMRIRLFCDLGGTGAKADAFAIWPAQFVAREIRLRDYYEVQGQPISAHLEWMNEMGFTPGRADIWLPHDGSTNDRVIDVSFESAFRGAGYSVTVVPNQGKGAAKQRIEASRRRFSSMWFDEETTEAGRAALAYYHEKRDEKRGIGLGPDHDWSSHCADAFGLMASSYKEPRTYRDNRRNDRPAGV